MKTGGIIQSKAASIPEIQQATTNILLRYCDQQIARAGDISEYYSRLWQAIRAQVAAGGKRLRPYLVVLSYQAYGGQQLENILPVAAAWEFLHISMLMHDDIIDHDFVRHGHPNVSGMYLEHYTVVGNKTQRLHYANAAALLAGDMVISAAYQLIIGSILTPPNRKHALQALGDSLFVVCGGELLDSEATFTPDISPELVAMHKTASYSFVGPLQIGARLAGAPDGALTALDKFGAKLGIGYQLADDMLDMFGNPRETGKASGSDLEEGKRTMLIEQSLALMTARNRQRTIDLLGKPRRTPSDIAELKKLITASGVQAKVEQQLNRQARASQAMIHKLSIAPDFQTAFRQLIELCLKRRA